MSAEGTVVGDIERHRSDPIVERLGYARAEFPVCPPAQQFADKLHGYTRPRAVENTRVKDLADMLWFTEHYSLESGDLLAAAIATFGLRSEHPWPPLLPPPPTAWASAYALLREELGLRAPDTAAAYDHLIAFLRPVFAGERNLV